MLLGDIGSPEESFGFSMTHNFSNIFKMKGSVLYIDGFFWNFEDTDFRIFDSETQSMHTWVSFIYHFGDRMTIRYKVSHTSDYPFTNIIGGATNPSDYEGSLINQPYILDDKIDFRLQVDYVF